ncbi:MAG: hypothetical protein A2854_04760 [Parcubacteria group bacterium RIFCSPHIGHO2_01_FULL_56_18]|nr:MAG: hypothetical protein A2854_04760 [Parcubacteria group bacterium RIFCSPHIGHO2_01_FULL_56_18]
MLAEAIHRRINASMCGAQSFFVSPLLLLGVACLSIHRCVERGTWLDRFVVFGKKKNPVHMKATRGKMPTEKNG